MKKTFFTILWLMLLASTVMAQSDGAMKSKRINVGIAVGVSTDWLSQKNDQYEKGGIILGLRYGIPLDINLTEDENYYVTTGVKLEHTGGKAKYTSIHEGKDAFYTRKYNAIFLCIPTGIKLKTPSFNNFVIAGNFGLSHAFALDSKKFDRIKIENENKEIIDQKKTKYENNSFFKEALFAGLGMEYIIKDNFRASLMINYNYTFTNYHNRKELSLFDPAERLKAKLGAVEFIFGMFF